MEYNRQDRVIEHIAHLAADFLGRESNRQSLITVTRADVSPDYSKSAIYVTVLPESAEEDALNFLKRKRAEFKQYVKDHATLRKVPFFDFVLDTGEKHRQRLDEISRSL